MNWDVHLLPEDVPQCGLHRADHLRADAVDPEPRVEIALHLPGARSHFQRVLADEDRRQDVVDDRLHDRGVEVAVGGRTFSVADDAGIGLDADQRECPAQDGKVLLVTEWDDPDRFYLHGWIALRSILLLVVDAGVLRAMEVCLAGSLGPGRVIS